MPKDRIDPEDEGGEAPCWAHLDLDADDPVFDRDATAVREDHDGMPQVVDRPRASTPDNPS